MPPPGWGISVQPHCQPLPPPAGQGYSRQVLRQDGQPPGKFVFLSQPPLPDEWCFFCFDFAQW